MAKLTKRQKTYAGKVESTKLYPLDAALGIVKECATAKFDESIDVSVQLGIDAKKSDQVVRGAVVMPNGTPKRCTARRAGWHRTPHRPTRPRGRRRRPPAGVPAARAGRVSRRRVRGAPRRGRARARPDRQARADAPSCRPVRHRRPARALGAAARRRSAAARRAARRRPAPKAHLRRNRESAAPPAAGRGPACGCRARAHLCLRPRGGRWRRRRRRTARSRARSSGGAGCRRRECAASARASRRADARPTRRGDSSAPRRRRRAPSAPQGAHRARANSGAGRH